MNMDNAAEETRGDAGRFFTMLKNLDAFNEKEVRGIAFAQLSPTVREQCFLGNYLRAIANVKTMLKLDNIADAQAVASLARSIFEMAIEVELIDRVPNSAEKILAFGEFERLRRSRAIVKFAGEHPDSSSHLDAPFHNAFIDRDGARIDAERNRLWPKKTPTLSHWTQLNLRQRAEFIGGNIAELYNSEYQVHSWYAHAGLTGVINTQPAFYWALYGMAYRLASDSYEIILIAIIKIFRLTLTDEKILDKLECAKMLSFAENEAQSRALWRSTVS